MLLPAIFACATLLLLLLLLPLLQAQHKVHNRP
jgi:hypothetical protein